LGLDVKEPLLLNGKTLSLFLSGQIVFPAALGYQTKAAGF
jgi:hypothetical protein